MILRPLRNPSDPDAAIEALAARTLAPPRSVVWRRFAIPMSRERPAEAPASLQRYFELAPEGGGDVEAQRWIETLRGHVASGN